MGMSVEDLAKLLEETSTKACTEVLPANLVNDFSGVFKCQARHLLSKLDISPRKPLSNQASEDVQAAAKRGFNS